MRKLLALFILISPCAQATEPPSATVDRLFRKPLTVSSAVQIALLNNRNLQATFEDVGIAKSDVLEAVTIPNPTVDFEVQFPVAASQANRYAWLIAQDFVRILLIPLKKRIAEEKLRAVELRVADEVLEVVTAVKVACFTVQADQEMLAKSKMIYESDAAALDLSQKQFEAGNITDLSLLQIQSEYNASRLGLAKAEMELRQHREELNRLLGAWGPQTDWRIAGELPDVPENDFSLRRLETLAVTQRADLQASHRELTSLASALGLTKVYRWVPVLDFGFAGEKDVDGALNMGPSFRLEIPVFNQGQSRISRGEAELRQASAKFEALAVDIRSRVRELRDKLLSLRDQAEFFRRNVLPIREQIVARSLRQYNAMQLGPYDLFRAKADQFAAEKEATATQRDYWITRAQLERTVGGSLNPRKP